MDYFDVCIIGGDRRFSHLTNILLREGLRVTGFGTARLAPKENVPDEIPYKPRQAASLREATGGVGTVICGIPMERDGFLCCEELPPIPLSELKKNLRKRQKLFGGMISDDFRLHCEERSIECHDFMTDEPLTLFNAVCTAEGAILEALSHKDCLLHQSSCLVLGFGRCGSMIAERLKGLCARVTVTSANKTELALAQSRGCQAFPLSVLSEHVSKFDYLFNTIPACHLGENSLPNVRRDSLIIDVASGRTGVDYPLAKELSLHALFCPGLPGKYAARSCAERLAKYVIENLDETKT